MVKGIDDVMDLFRKAELPHWVLYEGFEMKPSKVIIGSGGHQSDTDTAAAAKDVNEILAKLAPGKYTLSCREKYKSNQSGCNIQFEISFANGMVPYTGNAIGSTTPPIGFVHRSELELALVKRDQEYQMKEFQRQLDEIQKKKEPKQTTLDSFLEKHGGVLIGALMSRFAPGAQIGLQGFTDAQQQPAVQSEFNNQQSAIPATTDQKLEWVINTLAQKEGGNDAAVELLYRFTHYTIQNPEQYQMFKPMILKTEPTHE